MRTGRLRPPSLEPIEHASRDELECLQLERLKWSVRHAYDHVPSFQRKCIEIHREGALDRLDVRVELDPQAANVESVREDAARDLQRRIKAYIGVTASVAICNPGTIERSVGKAKRVFDRRGEHLPPLAGV
jgi:phenylacetate-coenzyme A ligase PaaK-like adenylate-forming protein